MLLEFLLINISLESNVFDSALCVQHHMYLNNGQLAIVDHFVSMYKKLLNKCIKLLKIFYNILKKCEY